MIKDIRFEHGRIKNNGIKGAYLVDVFCCICYSGNEDRLHFPFLQHLHEELLSGKRILHDQDLLPGHQYSKFRHLQSGLLCAFLDLNGEGEGGTFVEFTVHRDFSAH